MDGLPFYEEVPVPGDHSPHILNGHLHSLVALYDLAKETGDMSIKEMADKGAETARKLTPYYDAGYWTKHDLVPRVTSILFWLKAKVGAIKSPSGEELPLQLVSGNSEFSLFKTNLPGSMFVSSVIGHPGYKISLTYSGPLASVGIAGMRPDISEYYLLPMDDVTSAGSTDTSTFCLPVQYPSDSSLSRVYQRWHSRLMKRMGEMTGDQWYKSVADGWWSYGLRLDWGSWGV